MNIGGLELHEIILADAGFALNDYTITPYDLSEVSYGLDEKQVNFNRRVSRCRVRVENAIGYLKNRFSILKKKNHYSVEKMGDIIMGCCVLHNMILIGGDPLEFEQLQQDPMPRPVISEVSNT